jgi:hypothetical protein
MDLGDSNHHSINGSARSDPHALTQSYIEALVARVENLEKAAALDPADESDEPEHSTSPLTIQDNRTKSGLNETFKLPESTFTLLITHEFLSIPFLTGLLACALALFCLTLVLIDEADQGTVDNPFSLPAGVTTPTRITQYVGKKKLACILLLATKLVSNEPTFNPSLTLRLLQGS